MNDTIAIFASARRNGNTGKFIDRISEILEIDVIDLADKNISPFDYEHKNIDDDVIPIMDQILDHEKLIFASPVYWYAMSAQMKIFVDRISDFLAVDELKDKGRKLRGKIGYVVCTSICQEADDSFVNSFKDTFEYLDIKYGGHIHANCKDGYVESQYTDDVTDFVNSVRNAEFCPRIKMRST